MTLPIEPALRQNMIVLARAYAEAKGVKLGTVSAYAHGDTPFFDGLIAQAKGKGPGRMSFTIRKYDQVMAWFDANWPDGLEKPFVWQPDGSGWWPPFDLPERPPRRRLRR